MWGGENKKKAKSYAGKIVKGTTGGEETTLSRAFDTLRLVGTGRGKKTAWKGKVTRLGEGGIGQNERGRAQGPRYRSILKSHRTAGVRERRG